jgi:hypothetical protein
MSDAGAALVAGGCDYGDVFKAPRPADVVAALGGIASRDELLAARLWPEEIDLSRRYGRILRVRRGWYASLGTSPLVLRALRVGGRLACVSALAWYEGREVPKEEAVHVLVRYGASRLGGGAVVHWTRRELEGTRLVVSERVARLQEAGCRRTS